MKRQLPTRFNASARMESTRRVTIEGDQRSEAAELTQSIPSGRLAALAVPPKLLRFPAVRERTGLSRTTIWRLERRGGFPRHRRISTNAVAWVEGEVTDWIASKISALPD